MLHTLWNKVARLDLESCRTKCRAPPDWRRWREQRCSEKQEEGGQARHHRHRHVRLVLAPHTGHNCHRRLSFIF